MQRLSWRFPGAPRSRRTVFLPGVALALFGLAAPVVSQTRTDETPRPPSGSWSSSAEQEAEQRVSLSAGKIIEILRAEPGLLLQVKKRLVRQAFEQGRLLDSSDLSDEALFRLLREDEDIRILATREIEDRLYIRAKPSRQELAREGYHEPERAWAGEGESAQPGDEKTRPAEQRGQSREERYWSQRERQEPGPLSPGSEGYPSRQRTPGQSPSRQRARDLDLRQADLPDETWDTPPGETSRMARTRPEELPELLNHAAERSRLDEGRSDNGARSTSPYRGPSDSPALGSGGPWPRDREAGPESTRELAARSRPRRPEPPPLPAGREEQPAIRRRPNPYANVPALYDLYAQVSRRAPVLPRFGEDIFRNGTGNFDELPMDLPVGPDYVLGPGDGLNIELWGGVAQRLQRVVDREGRVALPEVGAVLVSGRSLGDVQRLVQSVLRTQFRDIQADLSLSRLRTVRVYVVGDVEKPGAYDISSLSTPLNALYAAGGPTARGSLRTLRHSRGQQLVQQIDTYELLLHGVRSEVRRLQPGDTILVPPAGPTVAVEGMVRRPALYELSGEKNLAEVLELAGGILPSGALRHMDVERVAAHQKRTLLRLDLPAEDNSPAALRALEDFQVQDGDTLRIFPILPYSDQTVYLDGHVFRPGKYPYREGMKVTDVVKTYSDLLPEPAARHAEIIRLNPPDYAPVVLAFNLAEALAGQDQNLVLKPFDTVRIFSRYDFEDPPLITVSGEVRDPGDRLTNGVTHLRDAIYMAGGLTPDALREDAQVFRKSADGSFRVLSVNLAKALAGDGVENILLQPKDRVFIHRNLAKMDPPTVQIQGEVAKPGKYPLGEGMTASELVRLAGGFKRSAFTQEADLSRSLVQDGKKILGEQKPVEIAKAMAGAAEADVPLRDGDMLTIRQLPGWNDIGSAITVKGEVLHPGAYGIRQGERLSSVLKRAGGLRTGAYPYGAVLQRVQVRELEEQTRAELIRRVQAEGASLQLIPDADPEQKMAKDASLLQWQAALQKLQNTPPPGRLVIHVSQDMRRWENTPADLEVRAGDVLIIPKKPGFVLVDGAVYNPTAVAYRAGKSAGWYLGQAGGPTQMANKKSIFVIRADGSVIGGQSGSGWFSGNVLSTALQPGDMIVAPEKAFSGTTKWKNTLQVAQLVSAAGIAVQVAKGF